MKYIALIFLSISLLFSAEIVKVDGSYADALTIAKKDGKKLMVMMTTRVCPWCKRAKKNTLTNDKVIEAVNKDYIFVEIDRDRDRDEYPEDLYSRMVPTFSLVDSKNEELLYQIIGYRPPSKFLKEINLDEDDKDDEDDL